MDPEQRKKHAVTSQRILPRKMYTDRGLPDVPDAIKTRSDFEQLAPHLIVLNQAGTHHTRQLTVKAMESCKLDSLSTVSRLVDACSKQIELATERMAAAQSDFDVKVLTSAIAILSAEHALRESVYVGLKTRPMTTSNAEAIMKTFLDMRSISTFIRYAARPRA